MEAILPYDDEIFLSSEEKKILFGVGYDDHSSVEEDPWLSSILAGLQSSGREVVHEDHEIEFSSVGLPPSSNPPPMADEQLLQLPDFVEDIEVPSSKKPRLLPPAEKEMSSTNCSQILLPTTLNAAVNKDDSNDIIFNTTEESIRTFLHAVNNEEILLPCDVVEDTADVYSSDQYTTEESIRTFLHAVNNEEILLPCDVVEDTADVYSSDQSWLLPPEAAEEEDMSSTCSQILLPTTLNAAVNKDDSNDIIFYTTEESIRTFLHAVNNEEILLPCDVVKDTADVYSSDQSWLLPPEAAEEEDMSSTCSQILLPTTLNAAVNKDNSNDIIFNTTEESIRMFLYAVNNEEILLPCDVVKDTADVYSSDQSWLLPPAAAEEEDMSSTFSQILLPTTLNAAAVAVNKDYSDDIIFNTSTTEEPIRTTFLPAVSNEEMLLLPSADVYSSDDQQSWLLQAEMMQQKEEELELPMGFHFHPTPQELLLHYLGNKLSGGMLPSNVVKDFDVYSTEPWLLPGAEKLSRSGGKKSLYFFATLRKVSENRLRPMRSAGINGFWRTSIGDKSIEDSQGRVIGLFKQLAYQLYGDNKKTSKGRKKTDWIMHEYRTKQSSDLVLCMIRRHGRHHLQELDED